MIKTYDEALKTLNDVRKYLTINRADDCVQELDKVARYFINEKHKENPTLEQCIKEWEDRGYKVKDYKREIIIESEKYDLTINISKANLIYEISNYYEDKPAFMTPELHYLLTKNLKALEEMKDDK